ncbi:hemocyanin/hexamerin middle domain protein [Vibrio phage 1.262.O._10N.286.51.A9]|nr:hemocyanin/hexamerin middle domain protein [Vibrio phage 1.262.O._10N.286.51.A9]
MSDDKVVYYNPNEELSAKEKLERFAQAYATNGGKHVDAYMDAGFSPKTAHQNARKYLNKNHDYVMAVVKRNMTQNASKIQSVLMTMIEDENVTDANKLKAIDMMLKNSGIQKETIVVEEKTARDLSPEERQKEIDELMTKLRKIS